MPNWPSLSARESAGGASDISDAPGSMIIATQGSGLRELADRAYNKGLCAVDHLRSFMALSKYSLGVALILCVTVIWVGSSVWIQHIFGTLEFNKPFFLTYFNTTGFCLWNTGFFLSARWRRTSWDETSQTQPVCVEDARLDSRESSSTEEAERQEAIEEGTEDSAGGEHSGERRRKREQHVGIGDDTRLPPVRVGAAREMLHDRRAVSGVSLTLSHSALRARSHTECGVQRSLNLGSSSLHPLLSAGLHATQPPLYGGAHLSRLAMTAASDRPARAAPSAPPSPLRQVRRGGGVTDRSVLADNDGIGGDGHVDNVNGVARSAMQLYVADECRDYSLSTSSASSAREEVVSVILTDEDALVDVAPWQVAEGQEIEITSNMLRYNGTEVPPRRRHHQRARRQRIRRYSLRRIWRCALFFCPLWFLANYLFNLSLSFTSVASNTILSSTSSIWALFLSYVLLRQRVSAHQLVAVGLSVSGTILVGLSDKNAANGRNTLGGNIAALLSAFFYAAYTSVLKFHLPDDERFAMGMVFGAVGILNLLLLWPGLVLLSVTGAEKFAWPTWQQLWPLLMNSLIGTNLSDVLWARSVVLTSPVVATLGLSLTTPLAMVVDVIFKSAHFSGVYVTGAILVMAGFLLVNLPIQTSLGV
ncbi:conserved hypothetical protein [Leishmania braziliensis MHOM/BR/75/M2904]|uniref:EamA domain-containing protein n=2 Tax=Leishmania braziliensis TaxID=5660 RepID=A4H4Y6_LEIBR|nr:conserved hypothetical protein [Leishmania braziliensis MHOM/BR/75/M2904]CAJ2466851.1 unnamed protein product [Leishmania braziliensis]CAJ2467469.1 unnamed protein product [Leishmania braziliensis]CAM41654.1 conserved hypothetical protein [Leishmania braziliensis MHOM/BR/75/M2904]SYZ63007.1 Multidrug_resistance_efflux_transporter/EamA-like_transporter_family/UAA_transporter_family [Leishmania braziliensis MHOM/BR/75/M2904]